MGEKMKFLKTYLLLIVVVLVVSVGYLINKLEKTSDLLLTSVSEKERIQKDLDRRRSVSLMSNMGTRAQDIRIYNFFKSYKLCKTQTIDRQNENFSPTLPYFLEVGTVINGYFLKSYPKNKKHFFMNLPDGLEFNAKTGELTGFPYGKSGLSLVTAYFLDEVNTCVEYKTFYLGTYRKGDKNPGIDQRYELTKVFGGRRHYEFQLLLPYGSEIVEGKEKNIYITDCENHHVVKFDLNGNFKKVLFSKGASEEPGHLNTPADIKIDEQGNMYIIEERNHRLQIFDKNQKSVKRIGATDSDTSGATKFNNPLGVEILSNGNYVISDYGTSRLLVVDKDGKQIKEWGGEGCQPGKFLGPYYLEKDKENQIYVVDRTNNRIQIFNENGILVKIVGGDDLCTASSEEGRFDSPHEIAIDNRGFLYVADSNNDRIQIFNKDMKFEYALGNSEVFQFPKTVAVDNDLNIYVSHSGQGIVVTKWSPRKNTLKADAAYVSEQDVMKKASTMHSNYKEYCAKCHDSGAFGAPVKSNYQVWSTLSEKGANSLLNSVVHGKGKMPARGGCVECSDADLMELINHLTSP